MDQREKMDISLSSISQLGRSCSELMQQHAEQPNDLERKILKFYVRKQLEMPAKESSREESGPSEEEEEGEEECDSQLSLGNPKPAPSQNLLGLVQPPPKLTGELEFKRGRVFLEVNRWKVS